MLLTYILGISLVGLGHIHLAGCIEPLTMAVGAVSVGAVGFKYSFNIIKSSTYCQFYECCDERSIPADINELQQSLQRSLYGQHIVLKNVVAALNAHFSSQTKSRKPLVISFHGTTGTGKNFVADQIARALYRKGPESKFVHKYLGRADFPMASNIGEYKARINKEVREGIEECPRSLFIFDEVDKMPSGIFETLASLLDYNAFADGLDSTQAIFLLLSNNPGFKISNQLVDVMKAGTLREDTKLSNFEKLLRSSAYKFDGGLKDTSLIEAHVIDHYIPFLPLEKSHVLKCIDFEFRKWSCTPTDDMLQGIVDSSVEYDGHHGMFVISGCKTLEKKVAMAVKAGDAC